MFTSSVSAAVFLAVALVMLVVVTRQLALRFFMATSRFARIAGPNSVLMVSSPEQSVLLSLALAANGRVRQGHNKS